MRISHSKQSVKRSEMQTTLSQYFQEIGRTPLLNREEEHDLALRIQEGDEDARQELMLANLRLVVNIAKQYISGNDPDVLMDLIQEGNIGLMRAVDRFKPGFGTRFSTYGVYWIRQAILRALKARRLVRLPENVFDRVLVLQRTRQALYQTLGREPTLEELAQEMRASVVEVGRLEEASTDIVSLEQLVRGGGDEETALRDMLEDVDAPSPMQLAQHSLFRSHIRRAIETLPTREKKIIDARFGLSDGKEKTLEEIGYQFGVSRERVRQLQNTALGRLRKRSGMQFA